MTRVRPLLVAVAVLLTGCSLQVPSGLHSATGVSAERRPQDDITVIPPGPRRGQLPVDVVNGFLNAQASADGGHAVARQFLADRTTWDDGGDVLVYDPASLRITALRSAQGAQDERTAEVQTTLTVSATVRRDGSYAALPARSVTENYGLVQAPDGDWRLSVVPSGLRLTPADRERSFTPLLAYYLAPPVEGEASHLVADQVFLPQEPDLGRAADALVRRLVAGPTRDLTGSALTAVPPGTTVERVTATSAGLVEVALSGDAKALAPARRQELSAQLVWTLRSLPAFTALRLRVGGPVLSVPGAGTAPQDAGAWDTEDPDGLAPDPPVYYVESRRLRIVGGTLTPGPATAGQPGVGAAFAVDEVAVTPDRTEVALLTGRTLRIGPPDGPSYPVVLREDGLSSPTWGSGGSGLWLLHGDRQVIRVDRGGVHEVPLEGAPAGLAAIAVARDGVRVALVVGGRLMVGRVDRGGGRVRVVGLTEAMPALSGVTRVAWAGPTSLVAIGTLQGTFLPVRLAIDGSSVLPLDGPGLPGPPVALTASPVGTVVVVLTAVGPRLYRATGSGFTALPGRGSAPAYPG